MIRLLRRKSTEASVPVRYRDAVLHGDRDALPKHGKEVRRDYDLSTSKRNNIHSGSCATGILQEDERHTGGAAACFRAVDNPYFPVRLELLQEASEAGSMKNEKCRLTRIVRRHFYSIR